MRYSKLFVLFITSLILISIVIGCQTERIESVNPSSGTTVVALVWKGSLSSAPSNPQTNWAYYNTTDKKSYLYDGEQWQILAQDGKDATADWTIGDDGYWYLNGVKTNYMSKGTDGQDGKDATADVWRIGNDGYWYLNGIKTEYMSKGNKGDTGDKGDDGSDGISIVWKGSLTAAPSDPTTDWAYYNTSDKKSYIFDGEIWQILAQDGQDVTPDVHIPSYTIIFFPNGGSGKMSKKVYEIGKTYNVPECEFTAPLGKDFKCWDLLGNVSTFSNLSTTDGDIIVMSPEWDGLPEYGITSKGNIVLNHVEYVKTSMKQVLSSSTDVTCDLGVGFGVFLSARGSVTLGKYSIGKYEVTQELYNAVMGNNPSCFTASEVSLGTGETSALLRPVELVNWYETVVFCNKLSTLMGKTRCYKLKDGTYPDVESNIGSIPTNESNNTELWYDMTCDWTANGYRLPTECEWEYAARGGTYSAGTPWTYQYSGSDTVVDVAWCSEHHTWEVGLKAPNSLGLYDMSGNVWEWCWDYYDYYHIDSSTPVTGPTSSGGDYYFRARRGGSFESNIGSSQLHVGSSYPGKSDYQGEDYGFRLACSE